MAELLSWITRVQNYAPTFLIDTSCSCNHGSHQTVVSQQYSIREAADVLDISMVM